MGVERYGSKTDMVVKLVLVFFIALLSFSVGTFVGKKFSDNQHQLAQLEPNQKSDHDMSNEDSQSDKTDHSSSEVSREVASVDESHGSKPQKNLSDEEIAKLAEEFVTDDAKPAAGHGESQKEVHGTKHEAAAHGEAESPSQHGEEHGDAHGNEKSSDHAATAAAPAQHNDAHSAPAQHDTHIKVINSRSETTESHEAPSKPAARMAEGHSPLIENPAASKSRIPAALPKEVASSAIGKYTVQVSSFPSEKEAQSLSASLKEQGFSAFYVSAKVKNETRYRVSIGLFTTEKEAKAYMTDLLKRKKVTDAIVQKISSAD